MRIIFRFVSSSLKTFSEFQPTRSRHVWYAFGKCSALCAGRKSVKTQLYFYVLLTVVEKKLVSLIMDIEQRTLQSYIAGAEIPEM